jgi:uncharacterized SAM-binding protein YcdF (DUF218 family)
MFPLSVRLAPSRFLDPALMIVVVLGVCLFLAFRNVGAAVPLARRARIARKLAWAAWAALWLFSMPIVSNRLTRWTETTGSDLGAALAGQDASRTALVVLAGGLRSTDTTLPPRERLDPATTARILAAARLYKERRFGLVILSGGPVEEGEGMRDLVTMLGVPESVLVLESKSTNTRENAAFSIAILRERGVETAVVVTSATHLRRAVKDFDRAGMKVIPAAADLVGHGRLTIDGLLPSAHALAQSHVCLHEILGYVRG